MRKEIRFVVFFCFAATVLIGFCAVGFSFRQMVMTITIPDGSSSEMYQEELVVPEGTYAFNFKVWGAEDAWGIKTGNSESSGGSLFVFYPELVGSDEYIDTESTESLDSGGGDSSGFGYDYDSELSRLELPPGKYYVWVSGTPGTTITIEYLLEER